MTLLTPNYTDTTSEQLALKICIIIQNSSLQKQQNMKQNNCAEFNVFVTWIHENDLSL